MTQFKVSFMEQRVLLAIILSLVVLFLFNYQQEKVKLQSKLNFQTVDNKELVDNPISKSKALDDSSISHETSEKFAILETENLHLEFSSLGGVLKNVVIKKYSQPLPLTNIISLSGFENKEFVLENITNESLAYVYEDRFIRINKNYKLADNNSIISTIHIKNFSKMSKDNSYTIENYKIDASRMDNSVNFFVEKHLLEYSIATREEVYRKNNAYSFSSKELKNKESIVQWIGFRNRYFCLLVKPEYSSKSYKINYINNKNLNINTTYLTSQENGTVNLSSLIFIGPQDFDLLKKYNSNFEEIVNFKVGSFMDYMAFGLIDNVAKIMLKIMKIFYKIFHNWGICIILLALGVYTITYPLTLKSMSSMKKMQSLQPEIKKIQEQNKNNPQKLNKEMVELYRKHKFNPFGGCLPVFLQMPLFVSLYQVLWRSFIFKNANFLWINDLSEPDRIFVLKNNLPIIGNELNLLPFLVTIIVFFQQRISLRNMVITDEAQASQQKLMANIFPFMIIFFFYKVASGLALYFLTFYFLSTLTQLRMSKVKLIN